MLQNRSERQELVNLYAITGWLAPLVLLVEQIRQVGTGL